MDSKSGKCVDAVLIVTGIMLFGITQLTLASQQCFECEFWPINGTDEACLYPNELTASWTDSLEIVDCEHACFVSNTTLGGPETVHFSRGCYEDEYCPDMCLIDPLDGWESCTHCCDDDLCNDHLPEEYFEDSTWCYDCGSHDIDCVNPSIETTLRTSCDKSCEINVYISEQTTVMRGCALNEDDCNECDEKEDCTFCCDGSFCNDAPPDVIARQSNLTQDCYSCFYSPDAFEVQDSRGCGTAFDPNGVGVELVQCSGVCKKIVSGETIERSCVHNLEECIPGCRWFGPCTYCCEGNNCNTGHKSVDSNILLTFIVSLIVLSTMHTRHL